MSRIPIDHPDDPRIRELVGLRDAALRRRREAPGGDLSGVFVVEGDLVVERALRAGHRIRSLLVDATRNRPLSAEITDAVPVYVGSPEVVRAITGMVMHRGCIASFDRPPEKRPEEVLDAARRVVVVENLTNPTNLGIIARSAVGLGADALILDSTSCDPLYRRASRVSMGEVFGLPWARAGRFPEGLDPLVDRGFTLVALTPDLSAQPIDDLIFEPDERVALVLGAEGPGLSSETLARIDRPVRIPMHGEVDSLNVAAAAAIACFILGRDRPTGRGRDPGPHG